MIKELQVPLFDVTMCLSNAIDLVSPNLVNHHKQVAYISSSIAAEFGLSKEEQRELLLAGALHDIGAMSLKERLETLKFELNSPHQHAELGYHVLKTYGPFSKIAFLVRYHHVLWSKASENAVPLGSHILHLADRVSVLVDPYQEVLGQVNEICKTISKESGRKFMPDLVNAFIKLSDKESFWLDIVSPTLTSVLNGRAKAISIDLDIKGLTELTKLISRIIDFRSRFTAIHSTGVAATAEKLASLVGLSKLECMMIRIAGYLHDLGKLAIPLEILEKAAGLSDGEFRIIKSHPFYTYRLLEGIEGMATINAWASFHHERLDGRGYPFRQDSKNLLLGSRIIAVADVFTAITEDRPYHKGRSSDQALQILQAMAERSAIDGNLVSILTQNYEEVNSVRIAAQLEATSEYQKFARDLDDYMKTKDSGYRSD